MSTRKILEQIAEVEFRICQSYISKLFVARYGNETLLVGFTDTLFLRFGFSYSIGSIGEKIVFFRRFFYTFWTGFLLSSDLVR